MRKLLVDKFAVWRFGECDSMVNHPALALDRKPINIEALIYSSLLQAGATHFDILEAEAYFPVQASHLRSRVTYVPPEKYGEVERLAWQTVLDSVELEDMYIYQDRLIPIVALFSTLAKAIERGTSAVFASSLPHLDDIKDLLPLELYYLIRGLYRSFEADRAISPVPRFSISPENVETLRELMESEPFCSYSSSHEELESTKVPFDRGVSAISRACASLVRRSIGKLDTSTTIVTALPLGAKLIRAVFGQFPGVFSEYLCDIISSKVGDQRRIVLYDVSGIIDSAYAKRLKELGFDDAARRRGSASSATPTWIVCVRGLS